MNEGLSVSLIAIHSRDGFISKGTGVPWQLPADQAHFRTYTKGKWLLLGRKTYQEMLGWFSTEQKVLVFSHATKSLSGTAQIITDVAEALALARQSASPELVVCGGGSCYAAAMPYATKLILTEVDDLLHEGVRFPSWKPDDWRLCSQICHAKDSQHAYAMTIRSYQRIV
jgi:dihydrofolate reductase